MREVDEHKQDIVPYLVLRGNYSFSTYTEDSNYFFQGGLGFNWESANRIVTASLLGSTYFGSTNIQDETVSTYLTANDKPHQYIYYGANAQGALLLHSPPVGHTKAYTLDIGGFGLFTYETGPYAVFRSWIDQTTIHGTDRTITIVDGSPGPWTIGYGLLIGQSFFDENKKHNMSYCLYLGSFLPYGETSSATSLLESIYGIQVQYHVSTFIVFGSYQIVSPLNQSCNMGGHISILNCLA
ncbi:hypothetical protein [Gracilinema caldarium]|uniref:hypothetical protein n=1 Tax=Gracilinema caldarium TaxID=215591 RepID=UPI0026EB2174|nr:hypothetical protein [Gracilinema caldarium]